MSKEAIRYLENTKEILRNAKIEGKFYGDKKPVREAFGTAYLSILEAINEALLKKGFIKKELPESVDEYRKVLRKYFTVHNGKLMKEFENLYESLHIAGYYRGDIFSVDAVKDYLKLTKEFIEKIK